MSDPVMRSRTNYFHVKDIDALRADLARYGITAVGWQHRPESQRHFVLDDGVDNKPEGAIALFCFDDWPSFEEDAIANQPELDDDDGESDRPQIPDDHADLFDLVASHLVDADVAVFMTTGYEKMRILLGSAVAVNARGEQVVLDLHDIYNHAATLATDGTPITKAWY